MFSCFDSGLENESFLVKIQAVFLVKKSIETAGKNAIIWAMFSVEKWLQSVCRV